jgi:Domain of unknown function (DUF4202)
MADSVLLTSARRWVIALYPYNRDHLLRALEWVDRLNATASDAVRVAALTHDMERAFPGPDQPIARTLGDPEYERAHAARSARIVGAWLREQDAEDVFIGEVDRLIRAHETGGWPDADLVQAADTLSFLEMNVELFLGFVRSGRYSSDEVRRKFEHTCERIRIPAVKELARPLMRDALDKLEAQELELDGASARADRPVD